MNRTDDVVLARIYYQNQYDRVSKLEEQSLNITSIVATLSIAGFTFGYGGQSNMSMLTGLVLPLALLAVNIFAILYSGRTTKWIANHRLRGEAVLEQYAHNLYEQDREMFETGKVRHFGRRRLQVLLHTMLMAVALIPAIAFVIDYY